jgi:hypothetical protein
VTIVILIFFIAPVSLSISSLALSVDGVGAAAAVEAERAPLLVDVAAVFLAGFVARGAASFLGARVFFTVKAPVVPVDPATLPVVEEGALASSVPVFPRIGPP